MIQKNVNVITNYNYLRLRRLNYFLIAMFIAIFLKPDVGWGQGINCELLTNPTVALDGNTSSDGWNSFYMGDVSGWFCSNGSPHHIVIDNGRCTSDFAPGDIPLNCVYAVNHPQEYWIESITQNVNIYNKSYLTYNLSADLFFLPCENGADYAPLLNSLTMGIRLANGLIVSEDETQIQGTDFQEVHQEDIFSGTPLLINKTIVPNKNYTQFQLYGFLDPEGDVGRAQYHINNVSLTCTTSALSDIEIEVDGNSITANAVNDHEDSPFVEYNWDFGEVTSNSDKSIAVQGQYTYQEANTYTVCLKIKDIHGCCKELCKEVTVGCQEFTPDFKVADNCPNFDFSVLNPNPNHTYSWSFGDGNTATENVVNHSYTQNSENGYTVTLTVTDECGDTYTVSKVIQVECVVTPCNGAEGIIVVGQTGQTTYISTLFANGTLPNTFVGNSHIVFYKNLNLKGNLVIDVPTTFHFTHIYCDPGSQIELANRLIIQSTSTLEGCDKMWQGIKNQGFSLTVVNSFINDALYAINIIGTGSKLKVQNTVFTNNHTGINSYNPHWQLKDIILTQGSIIGNTFTSDGLFKDKFDGQQGENKAWYGIRLYNVSSFSVVGGKIENMEAGIYTEKVDLTVNDVDFESNNVGILMHDLRGKNRIFNKCNFTNNRIKGIEIGSSTMGEVLIEGSTFTSDDFLSTGILAGFCYGTKIFIKNKNVFNKSFINYGGIYIADCNPSELEIIDNDFVDSYTRLLNVFPIKRALITDNRISGEYAFFHGLNFNRVDFISNKFTSSSQFRAFSMSGISQSWFSENYVENDGVAFDITMSSDNSYCGNDISKAYSFFSGTCIGTRYSNNDMHGIELLNDGIIGPQVNACNTWKNIEEIKSKGYIFPGQFSTTPVGELATASKFIYDGQAVGKPTEIYPLSIENVWFNNEGAPCTGPLLSCGGSPYPLLPPDYGIPGGDTTISTGDTSIIIPDPRARKCEHLLAAIQALNAVNTSLYSSTVEQSNWNLQLMLNRSTSSYGLVFWQDCLDELFALDIDISQWYDAEIDKDNAKQPSKQRLTEYNSKVAEIDVLNDQIALLTLNGNEIAESDIPAVFNDVLIKHNELAAIIDVIKGESLTKAQSFYNNIQALPLRYSFLAYRKVVWAIDMKIFINGLSTITVQEWDQIRTIANMCPLDIGQAVYEARGLLGLINEYDFAPIETSCVRTNIRSISPEAIPSVSIYPNPSDGVYHIQTIKDDAVIHIMIYDAMGKLVLDREVSNNHTIDLSGREPGVYYYKCLMGDNTESRGKLILIK